MVLVRRMLPVDSPFIVRRANDDTQPSPPESRLTDSTSTAVS